MGGSAGAAPRTRHSNDFPTKLKLKLVIWVALNVNLTEYVHSWQLESEKVKLGEFCDFGFIACVSQNCAEHLNSLTNIVRAEFSRFRRECALYCDSACVFRS